MSLPRRRCRGETCRATIVLVPTETGGRLPIDVAASPDGNVLLGTDLLGDPVAHVLGPDGAAQARARGDALFMPHWQTCPDADGFRR